MWWGRGKGGCKRQTYGIQVVCTSISHTAHSARNNTDPLLPTPSSQTTSPLTLHEFGFNFNCTKVLHVLC